MRQITMLPALPGIGLARLILAGGMTVTAAATAAAHPPTAVDPCTPVGGTVMTNFIDQSTTLGTAAGDLGGAVSATVLGYGPVGDGTFFFNVQHQWVTDAGDRVQMDVAQVIAAPIAPNHFAVVSYPVTIAGGTGRFQDATGTLSNIGSVDLNTGRTVFRYEGSVCFRGPLR